MTRRIVLNGVGGATSWDLTAGPKAWAAPGPAFYGSGPAAISTTVAAQLPGERVRFARHTSRDVVLPINIIGTSELDVETTLNALARSLDPTKGDVTLYVTRPDSSERGLRARYIGGLEGLAMEWCGAMEIRGQIGLRAHDPFWFSDAAPFTFDPSSGAVPALTLWDDPAVAWDDPLVPFDGFGSDTTLSTVTNAGDVDTWPTYTVTGPCDVTWLNLTTGEQFEVLGLVSGDTLVIDTTPGTRTVKINGLPAYGRLSPGSTLLRLVRGANTIAVRLAGATGATSAEMAYSPRYLTC